MPAGGRSHRYLRKPDGSFVTDEVDVAPAMIGYCRKLVDARLLDPWSEVARRYLGDPGADVIPMPLPPRAPAPRAKSAPKKQSAGLGWHGMTLMSIEVDYKLIAELTPDGSAAKIGVAAGTAAARAGLRTGDYVLTIGPHGSDVPLQAFDRLQLPAYAQVIVRFHRPGYHRAGDTELKLLKLGRPQERKGVPWWERYPKGECGRVVEAGKDKAKYAGQMALHPHMPKKAAAHPILTVLLSHYGGGDGAFPSYGTLARNVRCKRRQTARENIRALVWLGLLEVRKGEGRAVSTAADRRGGGRTNLYVLHWPEGWVMRTGKEKLSGAR